MADDEDESIEYGDIETLDDYQEYYSEEGTPGERYAQYTNGKAQAAADISDLDSDGDAINEYVEDALGTVIGNPRTRKAAEAKGRADAVDELHELDLLGTEDAEEPEPEEPDVSNVEPSVEDLDDGIEETEDGSEERGVTIDASEVEVPDDGE